MLITIFLTVARADYEDNGSIAYMCNKCDLYDLDSHILFDELELPAKMLRGPRPTQTMPITTTESNCTNDSNNSDFSTTKIILIWSITSIILGLLNFITAITLYIIEGKINTRKRYMQTAIVETE